jgi:hypothetical protein
MVWPHVAYVDTDKHAARFFADATSVDALIAAHRPPDRAAATWTWSASDYNTAKLAVSVGPERSFDALLSFYAGPISATCTRFVRQGGYIIANNSHGDAGIVAASKGSVLVGVVQRNHDGGYAVATEDLDRFMVPKKAKNAGLTRDALVALGNGIAFTEPAEAYVFQVC